MAGEEKLDKCQINGFGCGHAAALAGRPSGGAELADIALGGIDFAGDAFDVVMAHATEEEWLRLEERVRELIPASHDWKRERLVNILATGRKNYGHDEEACRITREMGTVKQRMFLLVKERKPEEAVALAREHFTKMPGIIINLARALAEAGVAEHGVALLTQLAKSENPHPGYLEWLAEYYHKNDDPLRVGVRDIFFMERFRN